MSLGCESLICKRCLELARTLRSTNAVESMIGICWNGVRNVKRRRDGQMAPRWCAAGMVEARGQFRRVNGASPGKLAAELERVTAETVAPSVRTTTTRLLDQQPVATKVLRTSGQPPDLGIWSHSIVDMCGRRRGS